MKGRKTGGRIRGTPNKAKAELLQRIQRKWRNYHPVLAMAALANDESQPIGLRFQANKEVAQYVEPKRKAVEVTGDPMRPVIVKTIDPNGIRTSKRTP
jgi:phage repressor protein C with HTH and peptisase S24 domain